MDFVEILTDDNTDLILLHEDNIHDLVIDVIPEQFRMATENRQVNLVMNIADFKEIRIFIIGDTDFFLILKLTGTITINKGQYLRVFADTRRTIKYQVF